MSDVTHSYRRDAKSHVAHTTEQFHTCLFFGCLRCRMANESCHTHISHVTQNRISHAMPMDETRHTHGFVCVHWMSWQMGHVTYEKESRHAQAPLMWHGRMSNLAQVLSCHGL